MNFWGCVELGFSPRDGPLLEKDLVVHGCQFLWTITAERFNALRPKLDVDLNARLHQFRPNPCAVR